jgi:outer membrane biosynthesis protein TonB
MQEGDLKSALRARRAKLVADIQSLNRQLKACDTMLAGLESEAEPVEPSEVPPVVPPEPIAAVTPAPPVEAPAVVTPIEPPVPLPVPMAVVEAPVPEPAPAPPVEMVPASPPPRVFPTPEELAAITARANSSRRGQRTAKVELAIAKCGDTFSVSEVLKILKVEGRGGTTDQYASVFWNIVRKRRFKVVKLGSGRAPTIYSKVIEESE